jgi:hypothetical protein
VNYFNSVFRNEIFIAKTVPLSILLGIKAINIVNNAPAIEQILKPRFAGFSKLKFGL